MSDQLVSIITPAFQSERVIDETIRSVLAQTHLEWEMLIAEDCSTDETREMIRKWSKVDSRIQLIEMSKNGGPAMARNAALERARGRWIGFLDSDDLWLPQKLERSIEYALDRQASLTFTGFRRIGLEGGKPGRYLNVPSRLNYRQLLGNTAIATSTVIIDTLRVGEVRMRKTYYDDFDCWLRILKPGRVAHGLNEDLMRYRVMPKSISSNKIRSAKLVWKAYRELQEFSLPVATWFFSQYIVRAVIKHYRL